MCDDGAKEVPAYLGSLGALPDATIGLSCCRTGHCLIFCIVVTALVVSWSNKKTFIQKNSNAGRTCKVLASDA